MFSYLQLIIGFVLLIKGGGLLVDGATSLARRFKISDLVIGLTVVSFGTSAPELFVNVLASVKGSPGIAVGNILGSNIANTLLILGVSSLICPLAVTHGTIWKEIPLSLLAAMLLGILANDQLIDGGDISILTRIDGLVLLSFFIIFLSYTYSIAHSIDEVKDQVAAKEFGLSKSVLLILVGLAALGFGGTWIVDAAVVLASRYGVSEGTIGLTIVAIGTSLPELATSAMAALKKNMAIAVGNVVGSNIFNILFVLGLSTLIKPLPFLQQRNVDIGVVVLSSFLLLAFMFTGKKRTLDRWEGFLFVLFYAGYISYLVWNN